MRSTRMKRREWMKTKWSSQNDRRRFSRAEEQWWKETTTGKVTNVKTISSIIALVEISSPMKISEKKGSDRSKRTKRNDYWFSDLSEKLIWLSDSFRITESFFYFPRKSLSLKIKSNFQNLKIQWFSGLYAVDGKIMESRKCGNISWIDFIEIRVSKKFTVHTHRSLATSSRLFW